MKRSELRQMIKEELLNEATSKVLLKPKEVGKGVSVTVRIDDEGYLILKDKEGNMIFLHPTQIPQLKKFLTAKAGLHKMLKPKNR